MLALPRVFACHVADRPVGNGRVGNASPRRCKRAMHRSRGEACAQVRANYNRLYLEFLPRLLTTYGDRACAFRHRCAVVHAAAAHRLPEERAEALAEPCEPRRCGIFSELDSGLDAPTAAPVGAPALPAGRAGSLAAADGAAAEGRSGRAPSGRRAGSASAPRALVVGGEWNVSIFSTVCFEAGGEKHGGGGAWQLPLGVAEERRLGPAGLEQLRTALSSSGFQRYRAEIVVVPTMREHVARRRWAAGAAFIADQRHASASGVSIAHFSKRVLRLYGVQRRAAELRLPLIEHLV